MIKFNFCLALFSILHVYSEDREGYYAISDFENIPQIENHSRYNTNDADDLAQFCGKWICVSNNDRLDCSIELRNDNGTIKGSHCIVRGLEGDRIDCPDEDSFTGMVVKNVLKGSFISDWEDTKINVVIEIKEKKLYMTLKSEIGMSLFFDNMVFQKEL